jgi:hypothetical protein
VKEAVMKLVFLFVAALSFADKFDPFLGPEPIRSVLTVACAESGVPVGMAAGLLWSESGGDPKCITGTSWGYWQLNTLYHGYFSRTFWGGREFSEFDPIASTIIAVRYLAFLYHRRGVWWMALVDYKHGPYAKTPASPGIVKLCKDIAEGRWEDE